MEFINNKWLNCTNLISILVFTKDVNQDKIYITVRSLGWGTGNNTIPSACIVSTEQTTILHIYRFPSHLLFVTNKDPCEGLGFYWKRVLHRNIHQVLKLQPTFFRASLERRFRSVYYVTWRRWNEGYDKILNKINDGWCWRLLKLPTKRTNILEYQSLPGLSVVCGNWIHLVLKHD